MRFSLALFFTGLSCRQACVLALMLGALNVLSFAPFQLWPIQLLSLASVWVILIAHPEWNKKQAAALGFCFAFGCFLVGVSWLFVAMHRYGDMPAVLALIFVAVLAAYLSLFSALTFAVCVPAKRRWKLTPLTLLLLFLPASWMLSELARRYLFTGFPWLSTGYAYLASPLAGFAPVLGVFGVSGIAALAAGTLGYLVLEQKRRVYVVAFLGLIFLTGWGLQKIEWTSAFGQPISVRLIQGNINQGQKFDAEFVDSSLALYANMMTAKPADVIAIPETALPILTSQLPSDYLSGLNNFARSSGSHLFLGVVQDDGENRYANSVAGLGGQAASSEQTHFYRYDKSHLVPFGEYVPIGFRWFVELMQIPLGDFTQPAALQPAMQVRDQSVMPNICYEDAFGDEIASQLRAQAETSSGAASILLNLSNLAWYGDAIAMPQHLQISQMRALETGRPMLRSTNTGATAIIDARGQVQAQLPFLTRATLEGRVQGMQGLTPYVRFGDSGVGLLAGLAIVLSFLLGKRKPS